MSSRPAQATWWDLVSKHTNKQTNEKEGYRCYSVLDLLVKEPWVQRVGLLKTKQNKQQMNNRIEPLENFRDSSRVLAGLRSLCCSSLQVCPFYKVVVPSGLESVNTCRRQPMSEGQHWDSFSSRSGSVMFLFSLCICKMSIHASLISIAVIETTMTKNQKRGGFIWLPCANHRPSLREPG